MRRFLFATFLIAVIIGGLLSGACSRRQKNDEVANQKMDMHGMTSDWKFTLPQGDPVEGRKLFIEAECYKCHEVKGEKFPGVADGEKGVGPELSQMAGMHPPEFFAESIINPNAAIDPKAKELSYLGEDGKSKMPDYSDTFTAKQVADLASYIASLKGQTSGEQMRH
ncbi:MAG TPA: c-type cytochrome [Candidatus Binatia bacterium]|jgi:mono/diheme cytochrome c family protein